MAFEKHSTDLAHLLVYHLVPMALAAGFIYGAIYLLVRLATRQGKRGNRKGRNLAGLNRQQRRHERVAKRHKRRY